MKKIKYTITICLFVFFAVTQFSCSDKSNEPLENQAPNTFLFLYPDTGVTVSQQKSRLNVHWWSDDPDGLVIGYYFQWEGIDNGWNFTTKNDSIFSLPIGTVDTNFTFSVMAVDNSGNGRYDNNVMWNGIDLGPEPFIDKDDNGSYSAGEEYFDIGLIDPTPAKQKFPIKNSPPQIKWNALSILPPSSYPVITVGWDVDDLDGIESVVSINLALNDTTEYVSLKGNVRLVSLRSENIFDSNPTMKILINGSETNIVPEELQNLQLDAENRLYVQAVDISGSTSSFMVLPDTSSTWFVKKPKGKFLVIDDYSGSESITDFYSDIFDNVNGGSLSGKYDVFDLENNALPYENVTFLETLKLFDYIYWYSDISPNLPLMSIASQKFIDQGGKIAYSLTFTDSSSTFDFSVATLQNFLPIEDIGEEKAQWVFNGNLIPTGDYPLLTASVNIPQGRTYIPNLSVVDKVYELNSALLNGNIAFIDKGKDLFFIGLPLHLCDGIEGSVKILFEKVLFDEFGLTP